MLLMTRLPPPPAAMPLLTSSPLRFAGAAECDVLRRVAGRADELVAAVHRRRAAGRARLRVDLREDLSARIAVRERDRYVVDDEVAAPARRDAAADVAAVAVRGDGG